MFKNTKQIVFTNIYNFIKLLLVQSRFTGLVTFSFSDSSIKSSRLRSIYNILLLIIYVPLSLYGLYLNLLRDERPIYKTTDAIILITNSTYIVTIWVVSILNQDKFIELLSKIIDFDMKLYKNGIVLNYAKSKRRLTIQMILRYLFNFSLIVFMAWYSLTADGHHDMLIESLSYWVIIINSCFCHQTIELVTMIRVRFGVLNKQINKLIKQSMAETIKTVNKIENNQFDLYRTCEMHHQLSKLIKTFNNVFGVILLLMFGVSFVQIVMALFYCTAALQASNIDWLTVFSALVSSFNFIVDTIYVCDVCYSTIEESNRSGELIHKIESEDHDIRDEIEMFSLQIANEQVEFSAAGFFPINYTLLFSIIGGVTTYIIILIQLSASLSD